MLQAVVEAFEEQDDVVGPVEVGHGVKVADPGLDLDPEAGCSIVDQLDELFADIEHGHLAAELGEEERHVARPCS